MAKERLTNEVNTCSVPNCTGFRHPGSLDRVPASDLENGPGALRGCPGLRPKDAGRRDPSDEPPDYNNHGTGSRKMGIAKTITPDNVTQLRTTTTKNHLHLVQCAAPEPQQSPTQPWTIDQLGAAHHGMVLVEACISIETLNSLLLLLKHPGYVVVSLPDGGITVERVPVTGEPLIK